MDNKTYAGNFAGLRSNVRGIDDALKDIPGSPWYPADDPDFWRLLDEFETAADQHDTSKASWLAQFVLIDDLGPLGRGMFLAMAALIALAEMPEAVTAVVHRTVKTFPEQASVYRKIGLCKLVEASAMTHLPPLVATFLSDADSRVRPEAKVVQDVLSRRVS